MKRALIVVDVQNDFCEGGSLPVAGGAQVAHDIAELINHWSHHDLGAAQYAHVVATKDHHLDPGDHWAQQPNYVDSWPVHCKVGTDGEAFHPNLDPVPFDAVFLKGQHSAAYSGFEGQTADGEGLAAWLRDHEIEADLSGMRYALAAGYPCKESITGAFREMKKNTSYTSFEGLHTTHPSWDERLMFLDREQAKLWSAMSAFNNGALFLQLEQYPAAEQCFRAVVKEFPECHEGWANLGYTLLMRYCDALDADDLRHFRIAPQVQFADSADGRRTVLGLVCTDRPGLLADIAQLLRAHRLRVHDARIATFGERAEDVFRITDEQDRPLSAEARQALHDALQARIDGEPSA